MSVIPFKLAVSAEMVFLDLPFVERVKRIHALGFSVEIWNWTTKDIQTLAATGADFTSMTGYIAGNLTDPEDIRQLLDSARESLGIAAQLPRPPAACG
jgi:hydroxypyruvate isomerase